MGEKNEVTINGQVCGGPIFDLLDDMLNMSDAEYAQFEANDEAGWRPIATWVDDSLSFLITDDPTDPDCAMIVSSVSALNDYGNPYIALKWQDRTPTHWMPVPVAKRAGV
jgi:hypothetical protein